MSIPYRSEQPEEPPARPILFPFKDEAPADYNAFHGIAKAYLDGPDTTEEQKKEEQQKIDELTTKMYLTLASPSGTFERLPPPVIREYWPVHQSYVREQHLREIAQIKEDHAVDQAKEEKNEKRGNRIRGAFAAGGAVLAGLAFLWTANTLNTDTEKTQERVAKVARIADNLAGLGLCADDLRMQLYVDEHSGATAKERVNNDKIAIATAEAADLPCLPNPPQKSLVIYRNNNVVMLKSTNMARRDFTEFISADWPSQKQQFEERARYASDDKEATAYNLKLLAGDTVYNNSINKAAMPKAPDEEDR